MASMSPVVESNTSQLVSSGYLSNVMETSIVVHVGAVAVGGGVGALVVGFGVGGKVLGFGVGLGVGSFVGGAVGGGVTAGGTGCCCCIASSPACCPPSSSLLTLNDLVSLAPTNSPPLIISFFDDKYRRMYPPSPHLQHIPSSNTSNIVNTYSPFKRQIVSTCVVPANDSSYGVEVTTILPDTELIMFQVVSKGYLSSVIDISIVMHVDDSDAGGGVVVVVAVVGVEPPVVAGGVIGDCGCCCCPLLSIKGIANVVLSSYSNSPPLAMINPFIVLTVYLPSPHEQHSPSPYSSNIASYTPVFHRRRRNKLLVHQQWNMP